MIIQQIDKKNQSLLLIDCGESIFERIMKQKFLENIKDIDILITHMHTDHIGSLECLGFDISRINEYRDLER